MPEAEMRKLQSMLSALEVDEKNRYQPRCTRERDGLVYCVGKEFHRDHVEQAGFVAIASDSGSIELVDTIGPEKLVRRLTSALGKGALR